MHRQFCDRCGADVTDKVSAALAVVDNADTNGNGTVKLTADLCTRCRRDLAAWLQTRPTRTR
ncbi:MAG TPA: hypothetical protein VGR63_13080 [Casimicrobiaceae bacterium]|jgi:ribosomal protein S27AE|nr:hypothetical protein [Casimicrobiaceae bacterium]